MPEHVSVSSTGGHIVARLEGEEGDQRNVRIHPTAEVSPQAEIGAGSAIWHPGDYWKG